MQQKVSIHVFATWLALVCALLGAACGGDGARGNGSRDAELDPADGSATERDDAGPGEDPEDGEDASSGGNDASTSNDAGGGRRDAGQANDAGGGNSDAGGGSAGSCLAATLLDALKAKHLMIGAAMSDESAKAAPFDARYLYLAGGMFDGERPCTSCTSCNAGGKTCANSGGGCAWWGCWQWDQVPPGAYVRDFVTKVAADGQVPMITYYEFWQTFKTVHPDAQEGPAEVAAANEVGIMRRYLSDFAFMLDQIGNERALVHIEPDFWGYAQQVNEKPASIPAKVAAANDECKAYEDNLAGLGRCLIQLVRKHAPNARVGFHASGWATKVDVLNNTNAGFDVEGEAKKLGAFLTAVGAGDSDFVVIDASDRDAAWYETQGRNTWWDDTNKKLPNFTQAFRWAKALAESVKKPVVWWQVPVGNMQLPNQQNRWKDNRVDYFLDHPAELVASHAAAVLFGAGDGNQTTPESDSGHLIARVKSYAAKPQAPCP